MEAQDLDKEDFIGKSDPLVEVWTQQSHIETTVGPSNAALLRSNLLTCRLRFTMA